MDRATKPLYVWAVVVGVFAALLGIRVRRRRGRKPKGIVSRKLGKPPTPGVEDPLEKEEACAPEGAWTLTDSQAEEEDTTPLSVVRL